MEVSVDEGEGLVVDALKVAGGGVEDRLEVPRRDWFEQACNTGPCLSLC